MRDHGRKCKIGLSPGYLQYKMFESLIFDVANCFLSLTVVYAVDRILPYLGIVSGECPQR